jgi:hypothetical protein
MLVLCLAIGAGATRAAAAADTTVYKVWFARAGKLWLVKREQPATAAPARAAMQALLAGPNLAESSYRTLLPAIAVWNPAIGSHLSGGVRVTGLADVFEASLHIRIVNQTGTTIARTSTTTTCGTGCWGSYTVLVPFSVARDQLGTIVVADDDTDCDGRPQHQVRIPLVLLA